MDAQTHKREALRLLDGLENGTLSAADAFAASQSTDPVLSYVVISFLRACYPASDPAATSVLDRVVQLTSTYPAFVRQCKKGQDDSVSHWLEEEHPYTNYRGRGADLIAIVSDKLDS